MAIPASFLALGAVAIVGIIATLIVLAALQPRRPAPHSPYTPPSSVPPPPPSDPGAKCKKGEKGYKCDHGKPFCCDASLDVSTDCKCCGSDQFRNAAGQCQNNCGSVKGGCAPNQSCVRVTGDPTAAKYASDCDAKALADGAAQNCVIRGQDGASHYCVSSSRCNYQHDRLKFLPTSIGTQEGALRQLYTTYDMSKIPLKSGQRTVLSDIVSSFPQEDPKNCPAGHGFNECRTEQALQVALTEKPDADHSIRKGLQDAGLSELGYYCPPPKGASQYRWVAVPPSETDYGQCGVLDCVASLAESDVHDIAYDDVTKACAAEICVGDGCPAPIKCEGCSK
jgi:hypothetical protein